MPVNSPVQVLLDAAGLAGKIDALAQGMADLIDDPDRTVIIGIRRRGVTLGQRIQQSLALSRGWKLPFGILDITLYRDDLSKLSEHPRVGKTEIDFDIEEKTVLLVDDVLYTGRTIRSALDELVDFGRPRAIRLAVLVDRGHREYPIQPDFAALRLETTPSQVVKVCFTEDDGHEEVVLGELGED